MRISCRVTATPSSTHYLSSTFNCLLSLPSSLLITAGEASLSFPPALLASLSPLLSSLLSPSSSLLLPPPLASSLPLLSTLLTTGSCRGSRTDLTGLQEMLQCLGLQGRVRTVLEEVERFFKNREVQTVHYGADKFQEVKKHQEVEHSLELGESMGSTVVVEKEVTQQRVVTPLKIVVTRQEDLKQRNKTPQKLMVSHKEITSQKAEKVMKQLKVVTSLTKDSIFRKPELPRVELTADSAMLAGEQDDVFEMLEVPEDEVQLGLLQGGDSVVDENETEQEGSDVNYNNTEEDESSDTIDGIYDQENKIPKIGKNNLGPTSKDGVKQELDEEISSRRLQKKLLKSTMKADHCAEKNKNCNIFLCDLCSYQTIGKGALSKHMKTKHYVNTKPIWVSCSECEYKTKNTGHLIRHHKSKHGGVKFQCELCELNFAFNVSLKNHVQSFHQGTKYPCPHCEYQATRLYDLKYHIQWKHSNLKILCDLCNHEANTERNLKIHKRTVHEGLWYVCKEPDCEYKATDKGTLTYHIKVTHEGQRLPCQFCDNVYTKITTLKNHIRSKHSNVHKC